MPSNVHPSAALGPDAAYDWGMERCPTCGTEVASRRVVVEHTSGVDFPVEVREAHDCPGADRFFATFAVEVDNEGLPSEPTPAEIAAARSLGLPDEWPDTDGPWWLDYDAPVADPPARPIFRCLVCGTTADADDVRNDDVMICPNARLHGVSAN